MRGSMPGAKNNAPPKSRYQDKGLPKPKMGGVKSPPSGFEQVPAMTNPMSKGK